MTTSLTFTLVFTNLLVVNLLIKFWLSNRQMRHVALHRAKVPEAFASVIDIADHQKAADYTIAKLRVGHWDLALDSAMLVMWTLLGGLGLLDLVLLDLLGPGMWQQICLVMSFILISAVVSLPLSYVQTFHIEQSFGFNRMTVGLWLTDMLKGVLLGAALGLPLLWLVLY